MEVMVHADSDLLPNDLVLLLADIPDTLPLRTIPAGDLPVNWRTIPAPSVLQSLGADWLKKGREVGLRVPSAVTPQEWNILLNPAHPDFHRITWTHQGRFEWDQRLQRDKKKP
jgi:RES domain-containing protein